MLDNPSAAHRPSQPPGIHSPPQSHRERGTMPRWPLALIASPAAVAVWSGWVGLGGLCGFGEIHPLPGIWDSFQLNTAITLPIGIESYGAYALAAWLVPGTGKTAREFAGRSALGALALGMAGQVAYHLLAAAHAKAAPWWVTMIVSCIPVITLALATALTHLLRTGTAPDITPAAGDGSRPGTGPAPDTRDTGTPAVSGDAAPQRDSADSSAAAADTAAAERWADRTPSLRDSGAGHYDTASRTRPQRPGRDVADIEAQALAELSADPHLSGAELARRLDIHPRRGQRLVGRLAPRLSGPAGRPDRA